MTDWYVRPAGGSYGNEDGTSYEDAWNGFSNITWGTGGVEAGDTLWVCGTHNETLTVKASGTSGNYITIRGDYPGDPGIIDGGGTRAQGIYLKSVCYFIVDGFEVKNATATGIQVGFDASGTTEIQNVIIRNCVLHDNDHRGGALITDSGCIAHDIQWLNNVAYNNPWDGIAVYGYTDDNTTAYNLVLEGNTCYSNGDGLYVQWCHDVTVANNTLYSNDDTSEPGYGEGYGLGVSRARGVVIYENEIFNNRTDGIEIWGGSTANNDADDCKVYRNIIYGHNNYYADNTGGNAIEARTDYADNTEIYNNLCYDNERDFRIGGASTNCSLYNNTAYGSDVNCSITTDGSGWEVKNNIFSGASVYALESEDSQAAISHDHNCYYRNTGDLVSYNGTTYDQNTLGTFEATALGSNPLFIDSDSNNFQLQSTSPCINAGYPIRSISSDIDGNIRPSGGQIDIGAYEYQQNLYDGEYVWYVRSSGGSYGYENGKTYANAWNGFSNIVWTMKTIS